MKNKYFKITKTITLAILLTGIVNVSNATDYKNENLNNICLKCFEVDVEQDTEMREKSSQLEDWMINDEFWKIDNSTNNFISETEVDSKEEKSVIENWMIDDSFWIQDENNDIIEPWMIDPNFWQI
ncbi:MAG TPA: hypothetical protein VK982_03545 [Bacteroidales bacterium]|nr:hypothetical protein [Bacteroidales bacterium]